MSYKYKFSVIIVTYNQKPALKKILETLELSTVKDFEVIIADDGGKISLQDIIQLKWSFPIKMYWHKKQGWENAKCRNQAARVAEGEYVLIIDGDTIFAETTMAAYLPHLDGRSLLWGQRKIINPEIAGKKIDSQAMIDSFVVAPDFRGANIAFLFSGANFVVPRDKYLEVLWNENIKWYGYDDYEFFDRWTFGHGYGAIYVPGAVAYHFNHPAKPGDPLALAEWNKTRVRLGLPPTG